MSRGAPKVPPVHARCPGKPATTVCAHAGEKATPPGAVYAERLRDVTCKSCWRALDEFPQLKNQLAKGAA